MASWRVSVPHENKIQAVRLSTEVTTSNDDFADAQVLDPELPSFAAGSNEGATKEPGEPNHRRRPRRRLGLVLVDAVKQRPRLDLHLRLGLARHAARRLHRHRGERTEHGGERGQRPPPRPARAATARCASKRCRARPTDRGRRQGGHGRLLRAEDLRARPTRRPTTTSPTDGDPHTPPFGPSAQMQTPQGARRARNRRQPRRRLGLVLVDAIEQRRIR